MTAKSFALLSVLLLAACDGGIFGTGGPDDTLTSDMSAAGIPDVEMSPVDAATSQDSDIEQTNTDDGTTAGSSATDTTAGATTDAAQNEGDAGIGTNPVTPVTETMGTADGTTSGEVTDGSTGDGTTGGVTDEDTAGAVTDGTTTDGVIDGDTATAPLDSPFIGVVASAESNGEFTNSTTALNGTEARVVVVNTSTLTLNIIEPGVNSETVLFDTVGIAPNSSSASSVLNTNATALGIVDNNSPAEVLILYPEFNVDEATLTTILVREDANAMISAIALATQTNTTDAALAKVRVVQSGTLGDASLEAEFRLQSAGANPGGVDTFFGPLSFEKPVSDYIEIFAGDYELVDSANRTTPFALTLTGGNVYTLLISGDVMNSVQIINDSAVLARRR